MITRPYKAIEIKSKEELKKNVDYTPITELKKDGVVLAKLWFLNSKCYYIAHDSRGKSLTLKYIQSLNDELENKWEENRAKKEEQERRRQEREASYNHFYERPGIRLTNDYVMFSPRSPFSGSYKGFWSVRPTPGTSYIIYFDSADQYFAWIKAVMFDDIDTAYQIADSQSAKKAILLGRTVSNYDDEWWRKVREEIMMSILIRRWCSTVSENHDSLADPAFENLHFVNADPHDRIWGIGYSWKDAIKNKDNWGENLLGKCYDKLRDILLKMDADRTEYDHYWKFFAAPNGCRILDDMPLW